MVRPILNKGAAQEEGLQEGTAALQPRAGRGGALGAGTWAPDLPPCLHIKLHEVFWYSIYKIIHLCIYISVCIYIKL